MELIHFSIDPHIAYHPLSWVLQAIPAAGGVTPTTSYQVITWLQTDATIHTVRHVRVASQSDVHLFGLWKEAGGPGENLHTCTKGEDACFWSGNRTQDFQAQDFWGLIGVSQTLNFV